MPTRELNVARHGCGLRAARGVLGGLGLAASMAVCAAPYIDHGDGTVSDQATGLMWDKCPWGQTWDSASNGCAAESDVLRGDWAWALGVSVQANTLSPAGHRGHADWRLPNVKELESLTDIARLTPPRLDTDMFPRTPAGTFWSATAVFESPAKAMGVHFGGGYVAPNPVSDALALRLVRAGVGFDLLSELLPARCGGAAGQESLLPPVSGLCEQGGPGPVSSVDGEHQWQCAGSPPTTCRAPGADSGRIGGQGGTVTMTLSPADCAISRAELLAPPEGGPTGVILPFGALSFALYGCQTNSAHVELSYSRPVTGMTYWKHMGGAWSVMPATLTGNRVSFELADNGPYDADPTPRALSDPGGPGQAGAAPAGPSPVPALAQGAALLWAGVLGVIGAWRMRRLRSRGRRDDFMVKGNQR